MCHNIATVMRSQPWGRVYFMEVKMTLRVSLYARVSTEEQAEEGHSIEAQLRVMRELCERKGWKVVQEYIDDGFSARTLKRPRFQQFLIDSSKHHSMC
jgi:site-specific DNA recombinase